MEYKSLPAFVKDIDTATRTVVGIFAVHGNVDSYDDVSHPGSFTKTLQEGQKRVKFLWNHDMYGGPPIALIKGIREVTRDELPQDVLTRAPDATGGVEITRQYLTKGLADAVYESVSMGASDEMSYGYDPILVGFREVNGRQIRDIKEVRLWEVSDVLFGANPATDGVKLYLPPDLLLKHMRAFLAATKAGSRHSAKDVELINQIAQAAMDLGATNITLIEADPPKDEPKSDAEATRRAEHASLTLRHQRHALALLDAFGA